MATTLRVSFCFFCNRHLWCQVTRTLLLFQEISFIQFLPLFSCSSMTITDPICIIEKMKDISKSVFWKAFRISTKNVSVMYTLICICFTSYASSASCSCWFSLRKGAILSTLADKSKTDCNEIKAEFCRDDFLWNLRVPHAQYPHSNYF